MTRISDEGDLIAQSKVRLLEASRAACRCRSMTTPGQRAPRSVQAVERKIVVQGRVNGVPVDFVLDTGSERTGISRRTARRAGVASITATLSAGVGEAGAARLELGARRQHRSRHAAGAQRAGRDQEPASAGHCRGGRARASRRCRSAMSVVVDYQQREVLLARTLPEGQADFKLPMRDAPAADGARDAQLDASGVLRRRHRRRGDLDQRRDGAVAGDAAGAQDSAAGVRDVGLWTRTRSCCRVWTSTSMRSNTATSGSSSSTCARPSVLLGFQLGGIVGHKFLAATGCRWTWSAASCGSRSCRRCRRERIEHTVGRPRSAPTLEPVPPTASYQP